MATNFLKTWYGELGFVRNPFYLEPTGTSHDDIKGFINRTEEQEQLRKMVQETSGYAIVISEIGSGKSSFLNLAEHLSKNYNKLVIKIDPQTISRLNSFLLYLIKQLGGEIIRRSFEGQNEKLSEYTPIINGIDEESMDKDPAFVKDILYKILEQIPSIIIMDNLDKITNIKEYHNFLTTYVDPLPKNVLLITTGDINPLSQNSKTVKKLYEIFNFLIVLNPVEDIKTLKVFVNGRMNAYAMSKDKIKFSDEVFNILMDKTRGNIREAFRYLSDFLKCREYTIENLVSTIKKIDEMKIKILTSTDKNILRILAGNICDVKQIQVSYDQAHGSISSVMVRNRLDDLTQIGLVFKEREEQSKKINYSAASVIKEILQ